MTKTLPTRPSTQVPTSNSPAVPRPFIDGFNQSLYTDGSESPFGKLSRESVIARAGAAIQLPWNFSPEPASAVKTENNIESQSWKTLELQPKAETRTYSVSSSSTNAPIVPSAQQTPTSSRSPESPQSPHSFGSPTSLLQRSSVNSMTSSSNISLQFQKLLQQRLADCQKQWGVLVKSNGKVTEQWYLEAEIKRIEGRLAQMEFHSFTAAVGTEVKNSGKKETREETSRIQCPEEYTEPFCEFLTENPTVFHAVDYFEKGLEENGFTKLSERSLWSSEVKKGGKYYVTRNGSSLVAFVVGHGYQAGNGVAMIAGHIDALTAKLKPVSTKKTTAGYVQLGVAPYAGGLNSTWWDRDLGIGGRVLVQDPETGKITSKLVKLGWPIARIPSLAPHFGVGMLGTNNPETQAVPIIGLDNSDLTSLSHLSDISPSSKKTFASTQPPKLVQLISSALKIDASTIINWELELFDTQPAQTGGMDHEFIFGGRIDDKLCSWAAMEAFLAAPEPSSTINLIGLFDDEEIGSLLRQGARGNFLPSIINRVSEALGDSNADILASVYANSFLVSADVTHAANPNFMEKYLEQHAPRLNIGVVVSNDSNGHVTTDSVSTAFLQQVAKKCGSELQVFQIRNDSRSGGTVGPMLSAQMGCRAIDVGIPQLSMHSVRATTGSKDPGLGVALFEGFYRYFEGVDAEFQD